ncbi:hypothetical protein BT93_A1811 [Corymbia citriodora subsp. variegata]|nr:hypothetical protein BT93_A1811 [Corymbia citriodora subsp. variegata]
MEFPYGHHTHHHHQRRDDDDDDDSGNGPPRNRPYPPPGSTHPPDFYGQPPAAPALLRRRFSHGSTEYSDYPPPATVQHHQSDYDPHAAASGGGAVGSYLADKPAYKVYSKAEPNYSLTIRDSKVILAPSDSSDPYQKWYKDLKFSTRVKDEEGFPCFSLVNMATGEAIKHSVGASHPVQLVTYNPEQLDASVLWTESKDLGDGYRTVRMVNNVRLNLDALHGDKQSGGVHDGTTIVLWQWNKGDNQRWKITPYCKFLRCRGEE